MAIQIKKEAKKGGFSTTSEFMRHLIRSWNTMKLIQELEKSSKEFEMGKGKILKSLKDLK